MVELSKKNELKKRAWMVQYSARISPPVIGYPFKTATPNRQKTAPEPIYYTLYSREFSVPAHTQVYNHKSFIEILPFFLNTSWLSEISRLSIETSYQPPPSPHGTPSPRQSLWYMKKKNHTGVTDWWMINSGETYTLPAFIGGGHWMPWARAFQTVWVLTPGSFCWGVTVARVFWQCAEPWRQDVGGWALLAGDTEKSIPGFFVFEFRRTLLCNYLLHNIILVLKIR